MKKFDFDFESLGSDGLFDISETCFIADGPLVHSFWVSFLRLDCYGTQLGDNCAGRGKMSWIWRFREPSQAFRNPGYLHKADRKA